jgi:hypothetical protein
MAMSTSCSHAASTRTILLATLGGAIASTLVCAAAFRQLGTATAAAVIPVENEASNTTHELEFTRVECASNPSSAAFEVESALPRSSAAVPITSAKERDLRTAFVALEKAEPGSLDARAAELLAGNGPTAEKVALLRALRDTASPATAHWLDVTVRASPNVESAHAQPLPTFALEQLTELAVHDADACATLGRIACDADGVALDLRRRASAGYAAVCPADNLSNLSRQLRCEQDELVIASALSALESRRCEPQAQYVLALHQRTPIATDAGGADSSN